MTSAEVYTHRTKRKKHGPPATTREGTVPSTVQLALREALKLEGVPSEQFNDFLWIIAHESGGRVNVRNSRSSARGLFQLLSAQYQLNPQGALSFGNATEECQGGIRYVMSRYRSAAAARAFWEKHHWY